MKYDSLHYRFIKRSNNMIDIFNQEGKYLLVPAPKGFCNKKIVSDVNYLWINFNKDNIKKNEFYCFLNKLKSDLEKTICNETIQNFFYENGFGASIQNFKGNNIIELFYNKDTKMDIIDCPDRFYIKPLLWFQNIKLVENKWYINYCIIQAIVYPLYLKLGKCLIDDMILEQRRDANKEDKLPINKSNDNEEMITYAKHPLYGKYFKMISIGIPKAAVQIKIVSELGSDGIELLQHNPEDLIVLRKIKRSEHSVYMRFFKMINLGIPRKAVEQKMIMENIDIDILNDPDKLIIEMPIINSDFGKQLSLKKLKNRSQIPDTIIIKPKASIPQFSMADILKKRNEILNK
jgi:hypothetical protein